MKFLQVTEQQGRYAASLREAPDPVPGRGELLIRVAASGVNRADLSQIAGAYPPPPGESDILGLEVSGTDADSCGLRMYERNSPADICLVLPVATSSALLNARLIGSGCNQLSRVRSFIGHPEKPIRVVLLSRLLTSSPRPTMSAM